MPTIDELISKRDYYIRVQCELRAQKSKIEERIQDYGELIDFVSKEIVRKEGEEDGNTI